MDKRKLFLLIGIFWLVIIMGFIAIKEYNLRMGKEVLLKTRPIDPRDLFRGDYVILSYDISRVDLDTVPTDYSYFKAGDKIFVTLGIEEGYSVPSKVGKIPPKEEVYIGGIIEGVIGNQLIVNYGIESYFVPEGKGSEIEGQVGNNLTIKVSIDKYGNALIKSLLIDGEEFTFTK